MSYEKTTWEDEVPDSTPVKYSIVDDVLGEVAGSATITLETGVTPGTPLSAANLNNIEDGLEAVDIAVDALDAAVAVIESDVADLESDLDDLTAEVRLKAPELVGLFDSTTSVTIGDGKIPVAIHALVNGYNVVNVEAFVHDKGVTGSTDIQVRRRRNGAEVDVLSTKVTIGDEFYAADGVVNPANDDLQTGDLLYVDVDAVHTTPPKGLSVAITIQKA